MSDIISVTGSIATEPRHIVTAEGLPVTTFRLASAQRRYDRSAGSWVDAETNWYTVAAFRGLAVNAAAALHKGERILVRGRIRVRDWTSEERSGTTVEIEAESMGHDLLWGTTTYSRSAGSRVAATEASDVAGGAPGPAGGAEAATGGWAEPGEPEDATADPAAGAGALVSAGASGEPPF